MFGSRALLIGLVASLACAAGSEVGGSQVGRKSDTPAPSAPLPVPRLPSSPGALGPAHTEIIATGAELAKTKTCAGCHQDVAAQWRTSAHAHSSFSNPIYRVSVDAFRKSRGREASRFCAGCHDLALLADGGMDEEIEPGDPRAHAGITCMVCHGATEARVDGNGSLKVDASSVVVPRLGPRYAASVEQHKRSVKPLGGAELCGSCHRAFLSDEVGHPVALAGLDDFGSWQVSAYAKAGMQRVDDAPEAGCRDCHMRPEKAVLGDKAAKRGMVSSHRFLGGHTQLAAMRGDDEQVGRIRRKLRGIASIDIAAIRGGTSGWHRPAESGALTAGEEIEIDVVVRNLRVGHRFPGGTTDAHDAWLEVLVFHGETLIAASGRQHRKGEEEGVHRFRSVVVGDDGKPRVAREVEDFRARLVDHTLAPRGAAAIRYRGHVPEKLRQPLRIEARILHRSRHRALMRAACADATSERGRSFTRHAKEFGKRVSAPCTAGPITEVAVVRRALSSASTDSWERLYDHGEALLGQVQERVEEARESLVVAWKGAPDQRSRAKVAVAMAKLEGRLGRLDEAVRWADKAKELGAGAATHAAIARAAERVWKWKVAEQQWMVVTEMVPGNPIAWRGLATARGSLGNDRGALLAALEGLKARPRDPDLLRIQALSSRALGAPEAGAAQLAFERFRRPDGAADLRIRCAAQVPGCAEERMPVPTRILRQVPRSNR